MIRLTVLPLLLAEDAPAVREIVQYELRRLADFDDPRLAWGLLAAAVLLAVGYVLWFYRRESGALTPLWRIVFPVVRIVAWLGLALYFLGLEKRVDEQRVYDSQVVVLFDTSQSMSVADVAADSSQPISRDAAVAQACGDSPLLASLRRQHQVEAVAFDRDPRRLALWQRSQDTAGDNAESGPGLNWTEALQPQGSATRLGDALQAILTEHREGPLAGIVVLSDGGQNAGADPLSLATLQDDAAVPCFTVGLGSSEARANLRLLDLVAPARVYPGDRTTITGSIHGDGFAGRAVQVQLYARDLEVQDSVVQLLEEQTVTFDQQQQTLPVEFTLDPEKAGRLGLEMRIVAPAEDSFPGDNRREVEIEVVESQSRVLLIAGGPTRDYQFLRNQLFRDPHVTVDVWIQSASGTFSQEADHLLSEFPTSKEELYEYDCIVAFDPNWELLDAQQVELLESWVAEEAGGLVVVAGPIYTPTWSQSPELGKIRALYPVEFQRRLTLLDDGLYGSKTPWPILLTREGEEADCLWLADSREESQLLWSQFPGVYGCYAVKGPKPGARVLGWFGDPDASLTSEYLVYLAEQFYGSGRVFYLGSGELWRLRALDPGCFEVLATRLIRHVSQGRLLKGSSRGRLLVEQDRYTVGNEVVVRAQILSASREPLVADQVVARVEEAAGQITSLPLKADETRPGNFLGQFTVKREGTYRITVSIPDAIDEQLVRRIQVVVPDLEFDDTRRNDTLLAALAERTGGQYYTSLAAAVEGSGEQKSIPELLPSRAETRTIRGTPDDDFTKRLHGTLLAIICGALCLEWLCRRLLKLA